MHISVVERKPLLRSEGAFSDGDRFQFARLGGYMTAYRWIPWLSRNVKYNRDSASEVWVTPTANSVRVEITTDQALKMATSGSGESGRSIPCS